MSRPVVLRRRKTEELPDNSPAGHAKPDGLMFGSSLADVFKTPCPFGKAA
jgi:hypothetical protein